MTLELNFEEQQLLADTRRKRTAPFVLSRRELAAELTAGLGFVATVAALWWLAPPHGLNPAAAILSVIVLVLAIRVSFETPSGFTVATQLAFVPLLFAMPGALVPVAVAVALVASLLPDVRAGERQLKTLLRAPANAWFSVGPVLVFTIAGVHPADAGPVVLLLALGAQFACDFSASALYFGIAEGDGPLAHVGESWVYVIDAALSTVALAVAEEMHRAPYAVLAVVPLLGLLAMFARERSGRLRSLLELNDTYRGTAVLLGDVIAADDGYTGAHSEGVVGLALAVGDALGLDAARRRNLEFGAMLHDVGKIRIPKEIINKPGKLDPHEWEIIKTHPAEGERMLNRVGGFMVEVGQIVRHHHERWDGGGYPDRLVGTAIPLEARIITACDSWSAMRTDRSYRRALPVQDAWAEMVSNSGTQFDPRVVRTLLDVVTATEEGTRATTETVDVENDPPAAAPPDPSPAAEPTPAAAPQTTPAAV
jgi:HD-GYP domain-containing protein (c-di-GMP phosphodiesterase class II)